MATNELDAFQISAMTAINSLFEEFERLSLWNAAYQQAMASVSDPKAFETQVRRIARDSHTLHGIPKYSDLRQQAIDAVQSRNPSEFAGLVQTVKERIAAWGGIPSNHS